MKREIEDPERYLVVLEARIHQYIERIQVGDIGKEFAALDLLASIFSAHEGQIPPNDLSFAYPIRAWREDQVLIPRALLRVIAEGWHRYREGEGETSLDQAFRLAGTGKGKSGSARRSTTIDKEIYLSNAVLAIWKQAEIDGRPISQDAAIQEVFEREKAKVSDGRKSPQYGTIRKAFQKHGKATWDKVNASRKNR